MSQTFLCTLFSTHLPS